MKTPVFMFLLLLLFTGGVSCFKSGGPCEEPIWASDAYLILTFKDAAGRNLYEQYNPLYSKDSLKITDPDGQEVRQFSHLKYSTPTSAYHEIGFAIYKIPADDVSFSREVCKDFVIRYRANETDTLSVCFRSAKRKCGSKLSSLSVSHRGIELLQAENTISGDITVVKQ